MITFLSFNASITRDSIARYVVPYSREGDAPRFTDKGVFYGNPQPEGALERSSATYRTGVTRGNVTGNIINGGILARCPVNAGDVYIYCASGGGLGIVRPGGAETSVFHEGTYRSLNAAHETLFFLDEHNDLFYAGLTALNKTLLLEDAGLWMVSVLDDVIYAIEKDGSMVSYPLRSTGSGGSRAFSLGARTLITDTGAVNLSLWGNFIYFTAYDGSLRRITPSGGSERILVQSGVTVFDIYSDGLFYNNLNDGGDIYTVGFYGGSSRKVCGHTGIELNSNEGYLYFVNPNEGHRVCRVDYNGNNFSILSSGAASSLQQSQNTIYFVSEDGRIRAYGNGREYVWR